MRVFETAKMPWVPVEHNARTGVIRRKFVREAELLPGVGYACDLYFYTAEGEQFTTPRHHHDFDQIRFAISGTMDFGHHQITEEGAIAYFPAGAYYGPQKIDEATIFIIQWSPFWVSRSAHDAAIIEMSRTGEFRDGLYIHTDEKGDEHKQDSLNAIWEHVHKRPAFFPEVKYSGPVVMHPDAYDWIPQGNGTSLKMLGRFTERDLQIYKVRWDSADAVLDLPAERTSCVFVLAGDVVADEASCGQHTMIWSDYEERSELRGAFGSEAICIGFPVATSL